MKKTSIGIIDMNVNNISILNSLSKHFKYENFIYINDLAKPEYEGLTAEAINERVKNNIGFLLNYNVKLIIVVSNTIVEYCEEYLKTINVPVINIVNMIIEYVNKNYEHKNMVFMTSSSIMEANLYQKHFKYNHLYNIETDALDQIIIDKEMKTNKSFTTVKELLKLFNNRDIDVIIPSTFNMLLLSTEIKEFMPFKDIVNLNKIINEKINTALLTINNNKNKRKGKVTILINVPKNKINFKHLLNIKYNVLLIKEKEK